MIQRVGFDLYVEFGERLPEGPLERTVAVLVTPVVSERNLFGVLQRRTIAYPMHAERHGYTVVPLGVTAAGREVNLLTGATGRTDVHVPVLWNRTYEAFLIEAWFGRINREPYLKVKWGSMDRLLARMAADWNRAHPGATVGEARFELFVFDLAAPDRNVPIANETLIDWSSARGIKSLAEIRREAAAIQRDSAR